MTSEQNASGREGSRLVAAGISKSYGAEGAVVKVLDGIDLELSAGCLAAIVGPSGCGKSTLMHILGLLEHPDRGEVRLDGVAYEALGEEEAATLRATRIGFVFQFDHLLPELTLAENVAVPLRLSGVSRRAALDRALASLADVSLTDQAHRFPKELSGGERQRGAIARALVHDPVLLLADEPTGNLDRGNALQVLDLFRKLARKPGRVAIVVTHDPAVASGCDKIFSLERTALREAEGV